MLNYYGWCLAFRAYTHIEGDHMSRLFTCAACKGFLRRESTSCPHCNAAQTPSVPVGKLGVGLLACLGGSAFAITLMACYGACPPGPQGCYEPPDDLTPPVCPTRDGGTTDAGTADGGC